MIQKLLITYGTSGETSGMRLANSGYMHLAEVSTLVKKLRNEVPSCRLLIILYQQFVRGRQWI